MGGVFAQTPGGASFRQVSPGVIQTFVSFLTHIPALPLRSPFGHPSARPPVHPSTRPPICLCFQNKHHDHAEHGMIMDESSNLPAAIHRCIIK
jgi:hypothetical protein